jgi:hypothetical protein
MNMSDSDDKREFLRVEHETPVELKLVRGEELSAKKEVMSRNISASGLLIRTRNESSIPNLSSVVWIKLDDKMANICGEIENDLILFNGGVFGRVVRIAEGEPGQSYDVGVCFLRSSNMAEDDIKALTDGLDKTNKK